MIFHVDANSFYAACERLFRPDLIGKPIAVLSNNDGIIIALNQECKDAGFRRGDVFYKSKIELEKKGVTIFSSNYTLYADISARLNCIYSRLTPEVEIYSIDESFLRFPDWKSGNLLEIGHEIRNLAARDVGMPVSVGIAPTKTLAKLCNKLAKVRGGVCLWDELNPNEELVKYPVGDIWGIGNAKTAVLARYGILTALDLKNYPLHLAKDNLSITGMRTVQELNEIAVIDRVERERKQNICTSKSFASAVSDLESLETALSDYTQNAVRRMREERSACRYVAVYLMTNPCSEIGEQYFNSASAELAAPSSYLPDIQRAALDLLKSMYRPGFRYRKVMINLLDLREDRTAQQELFATNENKPKQDAIMSACDKVNERYGRGTIRLGTRILARETLDDGSSNKWVMKREYLSPEYTTRLSDVPKVK